MFVFRPKSLRSSRITKKNRAAKKSARRTLCCEQLEQRQLLSINVEPSWTEAGPRSIQFGQVEDIFPNDPVIGAIEAIAAHPTNPDILYAGSVNGGIWKTETATSPLALWTPLTDEQASLSISAIKFDPTDATANTLVAGIGNFASGNSAGGALTGGLRTTDGGSTWTSLNSLAGHRIRSVFPRGNTILVSSNISSTDQGGVFLSVDTGLNFNPTLSFSPAPATPIHLSEDPADSNRFYAGVPDNDDGNGVGVGIYRTDDGGQTWSGPFDATNGLTGLADSARIETSVGAGGAVFAGIINGQSQLTGMFWSIDQGNTWASIGVPFTLEDGDPIGIHPRPKPASQGKIHFSILADPNQPGVVYVGGDRQPDEGGTFPNSIGCENYSGRLFKGNAVANDWVHITCDPWIGPGLQLSGGANGTSPHADSRDMVIDANGDLIESDDGGVYRLLARDDATQRIWESVNGSLGTTEFYSVAYDPITDRLLGGTQDVGSIHAPSSASTSWRTIDEGDGAVVAVDHTSLPGFSLHYNSAQNLRDFQWRLFNGVPGGSLVVKHPIGLQVGTPNGPVDLRLADATSMDRIVIPWALNSVDATRMLIGTEFLYESFNRGDDLTAIGGVLQEDVGRVSALAYGGRLNNNDAPDIAWVASVERDSDGRFTIPSLLLRTTAGGTFDPVDAYVDAGGGRPRDIVLDPQAWTTAFVADSNQVWSTTDMGTSWVDISGNLASLVQTNLPASAGIGLRSVEYIPTLGALVVGARNGVYVTLDPTASNVQWLPLGVNLPNAVVTDLRYDPIDDLLLVGTRGRGAWVIDNATSEIANTGQLIINGDMDFAGQNDEIQLAPNSGNPALLDIFVNSVTPNLSVPLSGITGIQINGLGGVDTISVDLTSFAGILNIDGGSDDDTILISPNIATLDGYPDSQLMQINGGGGTNDVLIVDDSGSSNNHNYFFQHDLSDPVHTAVITRDFDESFEHKFVHQVIFKAGSGVNELRVFGTPANTDLTVHGGVSDDDFFLGTAAANVDDIRSHVTIYGGNGTNTAIVNDDGSGQPTNVIVTANTVDDAPNNNLFGFDGTVEYYDLDSLTINLGDANHTVDIESISADTTINANLGDDVITVAGGSDPNSGVGEGTVDGINSILTINGEEDFDTLTVIDAGSTVPKQMTVTDTTIGMGMNDTFAGGGLGWIEYDSIGELNILMGSGGNTVFVESTHPDTDKVALKTGDGSDQTTVANGAATLNSIFSKLDLNGQQGLLDKLTLDDSGDTQPTTVTLTPTHVGNEPGDNILGNSTQGGSVAYSDWEELSLSTGTSDDSVFVMGTAQLTETAVSAGSGSDQIAVDSNGAALGGLADFVESHLIVDGGGDGNLVLNDESQVGPSDVTLTDNAVLATGLLGAFGHVSYKNLKHLAIRSGTGVNRYDIQSTSSGTPVDLIGGADTNIFAFDSNGLATPGGHVDEIRSRVSVFGNAGNDGIIVQNQDGTGDEVAVQPATAQQGRVDGDFFFGGGSIAYDAVDLLGVVTTTHEDTINVEPSPSASGTVISIIANTPTFSDPPPGDTLNFDLTGVSDQQVNLLDLGIAQLSSSSHAPVFFGNTELVTVTAGKPFDLIVDMAAPNASNLGGNDSVADILEASSGKVATDKTLNLQINGSPAFTASESAVRSLTVIGSGDDDTLIVGETIHGLPSFPGTAPDSHTNSQFSSSALTPQNVGLQYDGGPGAASDQFKLVLLNTHTVSEYQDTFQLPNIDPNSGVINVKGEFTLSYESLSPIEIEGAGGTVHIDAALLHIMTELSLRNLGGDNYEVGGDGGFELTTFRGFDDYSVLPPPGVVMQKGVVVNSTRDGSDTNPGDGVCRTGDGSAECTLRAAIEEANAGAVDMIHFSIPGPGPHMIRPATALPDVTDAVVIDGYTEPGALANTNPVGGLNTVIMVEVNGGLITDGSSGLVLAAGASTVRGLAITEFAGVDMRSGLPRASGGLVLSGKGSHHVQGNFIGTDPAGLAARGNKSSGIYIGSPNNVIGGISPDARNLIAANQRSGIHLCCDAATGNRVEGNLIGTDATGADQLGNGGDGIHLNSVSNNVIGGTTATAGNTIAFNRTGVEVTSASPTLPAGGNRIQGNSIHGNRLLGIDLSPSGVNADGPTTNDVGDADPGANGLQNFPLVYSVRTGGTTTVSGVLDSLPDTRFQLEFFANRSPDPSGYGEGERFLGSILVTTDAAGHTPYDANLSGRTAPGEWITATATNMFTGDTSEFSSAVNASIFLDRSVLHILGTPADDQIEVRRIGCEYFVSANYLPPGTPALSFHASRVQRIEIATHGGDDTVNVSVPPCAITPADLSVAAGRGNDVISFEGHFSLDSQPPSLVDFQLTVVAGPGDDAVDVSEIVAPTGTSEESGGMQVGADNVLAVDGTVGHKFESMIDGGRGNDRISFLGQVSRTPIPMPPAIDFFLNIAGGVGDDVVDVIEVIQPAATAMVAAAGLPARDDPVVDGNGPSRFETIIHGGRGRDVLNVDSLWVGQNSAGSVRPMAGSAPFQLSANGGGGPDVIRVLAKVGQAFNVVPEPRIPQVHATGGAGRDRITVGIESVAGIAPQTFRLLTDGGGGADRIRVRTDVVDLAADDLSPLSVVQARGGAGNDFITLLAEGDEGAYETLLIDGGAGFDVCSGSQNVTEMNCEATRDVDDLFGLRDFLDDLLLKLDSDLLPLGT